MTYNVKILADSISPGGVRLTTLAVTFPRFLLAEVNTHRMLSRNSASSRAIPTEKLIKRVMENPFVPETFNKRVKGMGVGDPLDEDDTDRACNAWINAANCAAFYSECLNEIGIDKSRANRILEPFLWHTAIISATEWENFFALRDHSDAQPEFQITARLMREAMESSEPYPLANGQWHLPLVSCKSFYVGETEVDWQKWKLVSAGRVARVSFDTHEEQETPEKSAERAKRLMDSGHLSPFEHVARPLESMDFDFVESNIDVAAGFVHTDSFCGNFRGWVQFRKEIPHESCFSKVIEAKES